MPTSRSTSRGTSRVSNPAPHLKERPVERSSDSATPVELGRKAPAFSLVDQSGETRHLRDCLGRPVVLYLYPKDDTPGCTTEACGFRDRWHDIERTTAVVLGVSPDSSDSHAAFARKFDLPFLLLTDRVGRNGVPKVCAKYGAWGEKTMYGRTSIGVLRTTYLIDEAGKVARRWDRVRADGHADEVLAAIRDIRTAIPLRAR